MNFSERKEAKEKDRQKVGETGGKKDRSTEFERDWDRCREIERDRGGKRDRNI